MEGVRGPSRCGPLCRRRSTVCLVLEWNARNDGKEWLCLSLSDLLKLCIFCKKNKKGHICVYMFFLSI